MDLFRQINSLWLEKIQASAGRKWSDFGKYAKECWQFYSGPNHNFLYESGDKVALETYGLPSDCQRVTVNKCFEMVDVFLPYLHHRNPKRMLTDRRPKVPPELMLLGLPPGYIENVAAQLAQAGYIDQQMQMAMAQGMPADPMQIAQQFVMQMLMQQHGRNDQVWELRRILMESVLDYTPNEFDLQIESRKSLTEALVAGRGVWWTEMIKGAHGELPGTTFVPVENFFVDPDFCSPRDWTWACRERWMPRYKAAEMFQPFGVTEEMLKGKEESHDQQAKLKIEGRENDRRHGDGRTHDLIRYFEVFSRCGMGQYLDGADEDLRDELKRFGPNVRLFITDCSDEPLNLREDMLKGIDKGPEREQALQSLVAGVEWPFPYHRDASHPWPFALCDFHHQNDSAWPVSHLRPALGEQRMLDWIWSHVAAKIKKSAHTKWLIRSDMDEDTQEQLASTIDHLFIKVRLKANETMEQVAKQLDVAPMNRDLFEVAQYFETMFEMRTGVSALLAMGESSRQMRSSYEAQLREKIIQSRPEAMADVYEETQSRIARNEAVALRTIQGGQMGPFFQEAQGGQYTALWDMSVYSEDHDAIVAETDARIESGSMRKPNVGEALAGLNESAQVLIPLLQMEYQGTGDPTNLNVWLGEYQKRVMPATQPILLKPLALPPPPEEGPPKDKKGAA